MAGKPVDILPQGLLLAGLSRSRRGRKSYKQWYNSRKDKILYIYMYICMFVSIYMHICVFTHTHTNHV